MLAAKAGFKVVAIEGLDLQHTGDKTWRGKWDATNREATFTKLEVAA